MTGLTKQSSEQEGTEMNSDFCVAVHGLVYLNHKGCVLSSEELADNICTNRVRVRKVMSRLKKAGLVETREGTDGGYRFPLEPQRVSLAQIAEALDVCFVSTGWNSGSLDKPCLISSGMAAVMDGIFNRLDDGCKQQLSGITIADIDRHIFSSRQNND